MPCRFMSFRQRDGSGSQRETPRLRRVGDKVIVSGYQHYELTPSELHVHGHRKYGYLEGYLAQLRRACGDTCRFLDIGSNTGLVSFLAERAGFTQVQALDHDAPAIDVVREAARAVRSTVEGRVFSFGDPLPAADVVFCGALIHWVFCLTADFKGDFGRIFRYLWRSAERYLVVEWVDPQDSAIRSFHHIERCGAGLARRYTYKAFVTAMGAVGQVVDEAKFGTRSLVTVRAR